MRRKKSNLDEMQEQELLEHNGCWIAFWGLLAAIIIQSILFGSQDCKTLAGEGIVFIVLSIYIAVACVRRGIWDRRFQMNAKTNLILSAAAALVTGGVMLDKNKLIESVEECLGWPYVSPGTNDSRGIDCSGLFVKAYRDQGASIYHGSDTIYRKYCSEKGISVSLHSFAVQPLCHIHLTRGKHVRIPEGDIDALMPNPICNRHRAESHVDQE